MTTPANPTPVGNDRPASASELLARARQVNDPKVTRAAERVQAASDTLSAALTEYEARSTARREVDRLERQLAEAKARLKGGASKAATPAEGPARTPCSKGCGRQLAAQGRHLHERRCTGTAA